MAATINTNIISINAQRNLAQSGSSLATSMQRLSSGLRVNSAKDDAAGLAISERMNTQVRGLTVASRNANDGISLAQTAEGALGKVGDMLQRMRELTVQAGNATNSTSDRQALQAEVRQLADEIDRVAKQTNFNGQKILDGSFAGAVFQVGANSGDNVTLGALADTRSGQLSNIAYGYGSAPSVDANTVNDLVAIPSGGLTITAGSTTISLGAIPVAQSGVERLGQVVEAINNRSTDTGVTAYLRKNDSGTYTVELVSLRQELSGTPAAMTPVAVSFGGTPGFSAASTGIDNTTASSVAARTNQQGIDNIDVTSQSGAWIGLKKIDSAVDQINSARATLGAMQSRFENAVSNIDIQAENLSAARGRIVDADFAKETANLSRTQILQQAGTAMVAQANQIPQQVLQLLQK
ncbi:flagellin [Delftia sp. PS-11]|uniref:flagellin n=1 Tax=Delftia sp. PS-11 TaxID=2767222 RepID=UPI0024541C9D|nr:flagellin [Delftia sp. PS-11]KAJ8746239.1 flagellin [Delftia sp. PS-11]